MDQFVLAAAASVLGTVGAWWAWRDTDLAWRATLRGRIVRVLLTLLGLTAGIAVVHMFAGIFLWSRFSPQTRQIIALALAIVSLLPLGASILGRRSLRIFPVVGGLATAYLWLLVLVGMSVVAP